MVESTRKTLNLFERHGVHGTFFILGRVANRFPSLVREVQAHGHELACHSYWHRRVRSLSPSEFREGLRMSKDAIEQAAGVPVYGYRAPSWSINKNSLWALDILAEEGFRYDSTIYPIRHDLYGFPDAPRFAFVYQCQNGKELTEIPPPTVRIAGFNFPAAGGGYFRIFPFLFTEWVFQTFEQHYRKPVGTRDRRIELCGSEMSAIGTGCPGIWKMSRTPSGIVSAMVRAKGCSAAARTVFPAGQSEKSKG